MASPAPRLILAGQVGLSTSLPAFQRRIDQFSETFPLATIRNAGLPFRPFIALPTGTAQYVYRIWYFETRSRREKNALLAKGRHSYRGLERAGQSTVIPRRNWSSSFSACCANSSTPSRKAPGVRDSDSWRSLRTSSTNCVSSAPGFCTLSNLWSVEVQCRTHLHGPVLDAHRSFAAFAALLMRSLQFRPP